VDVPETEALLFDPPFARLAASAATLRGKPLVSAEAFTCLYGWKPYPGPGPHQGREEIADLKLLADALLANGVNHIVWHGMPSNPPGGTNRFYATVHVGPDAAFADELRPCNDYLERVCACMRRGRPHTDLAVYLPLEDAWMADELPPDLQRPSARYHWELQHQRFPADLRGHQPTWVSAPFLFEGAVQDGVWRCGAASFRALVVEAHWLDAVTLQGLQRLAAAGLPVCLRGRPRQPGKELDPAYEQDLERLLALPHVGAELDELLEHPPLLEGPDLPEFWCRHEQETTWIFLAHPLSRELHYPMRPGQSRCETTIECPVTINLAGRSLEHTLCFEPYQSLLLCVDGHGRVEPRALGYRPPAPEAR
jgi:hypothetical protein